MAQMSLNVGGGTGCENFAQLLLGARSAKSIAEVVRSEALGDALDLALAHLDQIVGVVDAEDKSSGEEAADDRQYAILVDAARPLLDPFEIEAFSR